MKMDCGEKVITNIKLIFFDKIDDFIIERLWEINTKL